MPKTLEELVKMYKSDVETRITTIKKERDNCEAAWNNPDIYDEFQAQIFHWEVTLKMIDKTLAGI